MKSYYFYGKVPRLAVEPFTLRLNEVLKFGSL